MTRARVEVEVGFGGSLFTNTFQFPTCSQITKHLDAIKYPYILANTAQCSSDNTSLDAARQQPRQGKHVPRDDGQIDMARATLLTCSN